MYKIGYATRPSKDHDLWKLDIDYHDNGEDGRTNHGAIIIVHGNSLSECMVKASWICEIFNHDDIRATELFVRMLEMAKVMRPAF